MHSLVSVGSRAIVNSLHSRALNQYLSKALLIFLQSVIGQCLLNKATMGASIPSIQLSTLKNTEIPTPPLPPANRANQRVLATPIEHH